MHQAELVLAARSTDGDAYATDPGTDKSAFVAHIDQLLASRPRMLAGVLRTGWAPSPEHPNELAWLLIAVGRRGGPAIAALQFDRFVGRVDLSAPWPDRRYALFKALEAAGSGTAINPNRPIQSERQRVMARRLRLHDLVDAFRRYHDPYTDWWAFRATLYEVWLHF